MPSFGRSPAPRLAAFYAAFFCVIGVNQPFWPLWLQARGLTAAEIGLVLAMGIGVKVFGLPVAAHVADRTGERQRLMLALAVASVGAWALFALTHDFVGIVLVAVLFFTLWPPIMSLGESLTMRAAAESGFEYGRVRLWGSLAYIATALAAGVVLARLSPDAVFWMTLSAVAAAAVATAALPDVRMERSGGRGLPLFAALADRRLVVLLVGCGLIQGSHAVYYAFATLHWQRAGYSPDVIGLLWAIGVVCEVALFAYGARVARRFGAAGLVAAAAGAAAVRWIGTGLTDWLPAIALLQTLHAFSFAAAHLGAMLWIGAHVPQALSASAQSLYSGVVWGLFLGALLFVAGRLYAVLGGHAFLPMAAVAFLGLLCAWRLLTWTDPSSPPRPHSP